MRVPRLAALVPALLLVATVIYIVANPSGQSAGQEAGTVTPGATPFADPTSDLVINGPDVTLPTGLTGRLTYRSDGEQITVGFPDATVLAREAATAGDVPAASADGQWRLQQRCSDTSCTLSLDSGDGPVAEINVESLGTATWSRAGHTLAFDGSLDPADTGRGLYAIDEPADATPRLLDRGPVTSFAWLGNGDLIVATEGGTELRRVSLTAGESSLALVSTMGYLHPSPDGRTVAFTQNGGGVDDQGRPLEGQGWHLWTIDTNDGSLRDLGNMGSDPAGVLPPVEVAPESKGPMYIGWSPDGTKLAFGGGFEPPYIMTTIDVVTGTMVRTQFPYGYPGEIKWSPDGTRLAVSTYDAGRTRHESYVVDPATGAATHIASGCILVWSSDGRFLAVHGGEQDPGISIVDVASGIRGKLTRSMNDTPLRWDP